MKIICQKELLLKNLNTCLNSVSERTTVEILKNFKIETENDELIITANNLETNTICNIKADIKQQGSLLVNAKTFYSIVSKLPDSDVCLQLSNENILIITSGKTKFNILTSDVKHFPDNMNLEEDYTFNLNANLFKDIVKRISFAASDEEEKVALRGVYFDMNKDNANIVCVATDGYRLAKDVIPFQSSIDCNFIIPIKTIKDVSNIITNTGIENVSIGIGNGKIRFGINNILVYSRLVNEKFPDYKLFIPNDQALSYKINRKDYLQASERINIIAQRNSNIIKSEVVDNNLRISAVTPDFGDGSELLNIDKNEETEDIQVIFNVQLLIDVLKRLESDSVNINLISGEHPIVVKEDNNNDYIYVMMPITNKVIS